MEGIIEKANKIIENFENGEHKAALSYFRPDAGLLMKNGQILFFEQHNGDDAKKVLYILEKAINARAGLQVESNPPALTGDHVMENNKSDTANLLRAIANEGEKLRASERRNFLNGNTIHKFPIESVHQNWQ